MIKNRYFYILLTVVIGIIMALFSRPPQTITAQSQSIRYVGRFTNTGTQTGGQLTLDITIGTTTVSGYMNFTNDPGVGALCGAGLFTGGTRDGTVIQFNFISHDTDSGCGFDWGWRFDVQGNFSGDYRTITGSYQVNGQSGTFWASADSTPTFSISGQVKDIRGNPIGQASINITGMDPTHRGSTSTDNNGNYTVSGLPTDLYKIEVAKQGYTFDTVSHIMVPVPPDATGWNFIGTKHYFITGRVTDNNKNPIAGVRVTARTYRGWPPALLTFQATTDTYGNYTIDSLSQGSYFLFPSPNGSYKLWPVVRLVRLPDDVAINAYSQDFTITRIYGTLGVRVTVQGSDQPIANAQVRVNGENEPIYTNGSYIFANIEPGRHTVRVSADGYSPYNEEVTVWAYASTQYNVVLKPLRVDGYRLPFPGGTKVLVTQGNGGQWSHQWNTPAQYAFDWWKNPIIGQDVVAVRDGKVINVRKDSSVGGCNSAYSNSANVVAVQHQDRSVSWYIHLQYGSVPVLVGQYVKSGQVIGKAGQTGYACGAHLHFERRASASSGWSIKTPFLDVTTNGGIPQQNSWYTSGNYLTAAALTQLPSIGPQADATPPTGQVQFRLTSQLTHTLRLEAFDYDSGVTEMRLAATEVDLLSAPWQTFSEQLDWTPLEAWAQFKDGAGNISEIYSDTVEAIAYEPIQAAFAISPTVCVGSPPQIDNQTTPFCEQCGWEWDLGDGNRSLEAYPMLPYPYVGYTTPGIYNVTLKVANADSVSSTSHQIEALPISSPEFALTRSGNTILVEAKAANVANWLWDFGDGTTATGRTASHTYTSTQSLEQAFIQLTIKEHNGCEGSTYQSAAIQDTIYLPIIIK